MCGVFCSVSRHRCIQPSAAVKELLQSRGPDASSQICVHGDGPDATSSWHLVLHSTVLSLRGGGTTEQPYRHAGRQSTLCWNGEAWTIAGRRPQGNDTPAVYDVLCSAAAHAHVEATHSPAEAISRALSTVAGPGAVAFYDHASSRLFFGRDFLGRRSLLYMVTRAGDVLLSSVSDGPDCGSWREVEADGIYCLDLNHTTTAEPAAVRDGKSLGSFHLTKLPYIFRDDAISNNAPVLPRLSPNPHVPDSPPKILPSSSSVSSLQGLLHTALSVRVLDIPEPPQRVQDRGRFARAKLAVLFSGGLDCTTLARMCHDLLDPTEPIDLLNVAFENPRVHKSAGEDAYERCPDRTTGRSSYLELCEVCPDREWRFVAVDVPYKEFREHRQQIITLMHPHNTEMDLSIAAALYFAARGEGMLASQRASQDYAYATSARVLLSGLGADELFAGYTRHETAYNRTGYEGLLNELGLDVARLAKRNLGRDDRVISHWGREARFPFLDEQLVQWALGVPVTEKCDFGNRSVPSGNDTDNPATIEPGKKVLRCLAWKLGMKAVAREKKRAIQFGARTAKMETGRSKGTTLLSTSHESS